MISTRFVLCVPNIHFPPSYPVCLSYDMLVFERKPSLFSLYYPADHFYVFCSEQVSKTKRIKFKKIRKPYSCTRK